MADLVRRAAKASPIKRAAAVDRGPRTEYLAFSLSGNVYAAPVAIVREILKPPPLTLVPRAPYAVMGIISVRGQLVTVVDLRKRLRLGEAAPSRRARILLVDAAQGETLGLFVDEVFQVYHLAESDIEPAAMALGGDVSSYIVGIARPGRHAGSAFGALKREPRADESKPTVEPDASVVILLDLRAVLSTF